MGSRSGAPRVVTDEQIRQCIARGTELVCSASFATFFFSLFSFAGLILPRYQ